MTKEDIFGFSEVFREKINNGSLKIVAGFFCLDAGRMEWNGWINLIKRLFHKS